MDCPLLYCFVKSGDVKIHCFGICTVYTCSKNDVISLVRKRYCAVGLELTLGLVEIRFRFSSKCSRSHSSHACKRCVTSGGNIVFRA